MCRLYGFLSSEPTKVECTLVYAQNALMIQSRTDRRGLSHADGWGIAYYQDTKPRIERGSLAAYEDMYFTATAERAYSRAVVAHVRKATVGRPSVENTHPFRYGRWVFAHNGTITAISALGSELERETEPALRAHRRGQTDSEQAFYWLLSRMHRAGIDIDAKCQDLDLLVSVLAESVQQLARRCEEVAIGKTPRLNFLLTDGTVMVASRWNHTLYWVERDGIRDCEVCGIPHVHHDPGTKYNAVVIASEPISHESWQEVPEHHCLAVDEEIGVTLLPMRRNEPIEA